MYELQEKLWVGVKSNHLKMLINAMQIISALAAMNSNSRIKKTSMVLKKTSLPPYFIKFLMRQSNNG